MFDLIIMGNNPFHNKQNDLFITQNDKSFPGRCTLGGATSGFPDLSASQKLGSRNRRPLVQVPWGLTKQLKNATPQTVLLIRMFKKIQ